MESISKIPHCVASSWIIMIKIDFSAILNILLEFRMRWYIFSSAMGFRFSTWAPNKTIQVSHPSFVDDTIVDVCFSGNPSVVNGANDPWNRDPLWRSSYDRSNWIFQYVSKLNGIRSVFKRAQYKQFLRASKRHCTSMMTPMCIRRVLSSSQYRIKNLAEQSILNYLQRLIEQGCIMKIRIKHLGSTRTMSLNLETGVQLFFFAPLLLHLLLYVSHGGLHFLCLFVIGYKLDSLRSALSHPQ